MLKSTCSSENITNGRVNTRVFPDPVKAIPIISLPDNLATQETDLSHISQPVTCQLTQQPVALHSWHPLDLNGRRMSNAFALHGRQDTCWKLHCFKGLDGRRQVLSFHKNVPFCSCFGMCLLGTFSDVLWSPPPEQTQPTSACLQPVPMATAHLSDLPSPQ